MKTIPAGVEKGFNIYCYGNYVRVLVDGKSCNYTDLPRNIRGIFINEMTRDRHVMTCLDEMGCSSIEDKELKFVGCRFGGLNETNDLIDEKTHADPPQCDNMDECPGYGIVCKIPCHLTKKEYLVARLVALGKLDKEICASLKIALPTCHTYFSRIHEKLGLNNKIEIALWAQRMGIV